MRARLIPGFLFIVAIAILVGLQSTPAVGAAWTRGQGDVLFLIPTDYFVATEQFDSDGDRVDRPRFQQIEISPYLEYGITDYLTVGVQPKYRIIELDVPGGEADNSGLAETDVFLRLRLWQQNQAAFSIQGLVKAPIEADEDDAAPLGFDQVDTEVSLLYGDRYPVGSGSVFYNLDLGFRKRFEDPADELSFDPFIGWWSGGPLSVLVHSLNTIGLSSEPGVPEALTAEPEFRRHRVQLTAAYRVSDMVSLVAGGATTYAGRNVGAGNSVFFALSFSLYKAPPPPLPPEAISEIPVGR